MFTDWVLKPDIRTTSLSMGPARAHFFEYGYMGQWCWELRIHGICVQAGRAPDLKTAITQCVNNGRRRKYI